MLGSALIVFRETLEAALLIGIVAAASRGLSGRNLWPGIGIAIGLAGALVVAGLTGYISEIAEGTGQELFNAAVLGVAVVMLGWHNIWMARHGREMAAQAKSVGLEVQSGRREMSALAVLIALAMLREGSETFEYGLQGFGEMGKWNDWESRDEQSHKAGPATFGKTRLGRRSAIKYNTASLFGLTDGSPDNTIRLQVELEF